MLATDVNSDNILEYKRSVRFLKDVAERWSPKLKSKKIVEGEKDYIPECIECIRQLLAERYQKLGLPAPKQTTVQNWLYKENHPDWVIALLADIEAEKLAEVATAQSNQLRSQPRLLAMARS